MAEAKPTANARKRPRRGSDPIVRRERKGRGGKTVTLIERSDLDDERIRAIKRDLGVGARREASGVVVVQGDMVERVREWLARG